VIQILHDNGLKSIYAHLTERSQSDVFPRRVVKGEKIGKSGHSGNVGAHLHFAVVSDSDNLDYIDGNPVEIYYMYGLSWISKPGNSAYPHSGNCVYDGKEYGATQWPPVEPPGTKSLELEKFTLERTNPKVGEDMQFEAILKNTGEVQMWWKNILYVDSFAMQMHTLRDYPLTKNIVWNIYKS